MKRALPKLTIAVFLLAGFHTTASAQLFVDTTYSALQMAFDFFDGSCVTVTDAEFTGAPLAMGYFDASATNLGMNAGILLSTGNVFDAIGPNDDSGGGTFQDNNTAGDADLNAIPGVLGTLDAAVFEMDIVPEDSIIQFQYVFGSEEYLEFVGSFNDVFAFFVSGPGIAGLQNIALVPGTSDAVSINNVNTFSNSAYYFDNGDGNSAPQNTNPIVIQYDGFTTPLTATMQVTPYETYHIKLAVADDLDAIWDSGVFISVESLCGSPDVPLTSDFDAESTVQNELTVNFLNLAKYATSWNWDFGDGSTSAERYPTHTYAEPGVYTVELHTTNYCCESTTSVDVEVGVPTGMAAPAASRGLEFTMSPNPVQDRMVLELGNNAEKTQVQLFDLLGNLVLEQTVVQSAEIDVSTLNRGVYFVSVSNDKGERLSKKIVLQ